MALLTPNYQDYVNNFQQFGQRDESGNQASGTPMSEADFNALPDAQKWGLLGMGTAGVNAPYGDSPFGLTVNPGDSRYSQLAPQLGGNNTALQFSFNPNGVGLPSQPVQRFANPGQVQTQGGVTGYSVGNETPDWFNYVNKQQAGWNPIIFAPILGAAMYAALGAGGLGAADSGGTAAVPEGTGIYTGGGFVDDPALVAGGGGQIPADVAAGTGGATSLEQMGVDTTPLSTSFSTGPATSMISPELGGGGLLSSATGLLGQAGTWAMNNPLRALGLAQTAYGLLGGGRGSTSPSGGNGSPKGGSGGSPLNVQQQFYTNPYLAAQIQRGYGQ